MLELRSWMLITLATFIAAGCSTEINKSDAGADAGTDTDADTDDWGDVHGYVEYCVTGYPSGGDYCEPLDGAQVLAEDESGKQFGPAVADDKGEYLLPLPPGTYVVYGENWNTGYEYNVVVGPNESVLVDLKIEDSVDAPYVYLYPEFAQNVQVVLLPGAAITITQSDPPYGSGWNVFAEPGGLIDGTYDYLFYESTVYSNFQDVEGWAVIQTEIFDWFEVHLPDMGLNSDEVQDFLDYWTVNLPAAPCYHIFPQPLSIIEQTMDISITPAPDNMLRLWLMIEGSQSCGLFTEPGLQTFSRDGFTVIEWGMTMKKDTF